MLLYHAGIHYFPGGFVGVDVFFVISGFLITGLLLRELKKSGTISLTRFYARRAKRLLPATGVVLAFTVVVTMVFLPRIQWRSIGLDVMAAAGYVVNWRLAASSVEYLNEDNIASPVQQFWSLAVEEQYYIVWPLLLLAAAWWFRRRGRGVTDGPLWVGLGIIAVPSLLWSIYLTDTDPGVAFFVTTTRMWELAIGAALAIGAGSIHRLPRIAAVGLGWAGVAAIAGAGLFIHASDPWPGYRALLPTLGTAAVIAAGPAAGRWGPVLLLGTRPFVWVGSLSYSLYLWHWSLIVVATEYWNGLTGVQGLTVIAFSFVLAWISLKLVENPFRYAPSFSRLPRRALAAGAAFTVLGLVAGVILTQSVGSSGVDPGSARAAAAKGAAALEPDPKTSPAGEPVRSVDWITPDPLKAREDVPVAYADGCQQDAVKSEPIVCTYGDKAGSTTVALVGDSKVLQWLPAVQKIAERQHWKVLTITKSACAFADATIINGSGPYTSCRDWNQKVDALLQQNPPDVVLTSSGKHQAVVGNNPSQVSVEAMAAGLGRSWRLATKAGSRVIVLRDTPSTGKQVDECVAEHTDDLTQCTFSRERGRRTDGSAPQLLAAKADKDAHLIDMTDQFCPRQTCVPVIGNVLVYRQGSHLTATYIATMAPTLERRMLAVMR